MKKKKIKAKWSVISATSLTFLTFVCLVTENANGISSLEEFVTINNSNKTVPLENNQTVETEGTTEEPNWSQEEDQIFEAPSSGFEQGHGSSGSSR